MLLEAVWLKMEAVDSCRGCFYLWRLNGYRRVLWIHIEAFYITGDCVATDGGCGFM
jgi:hypothetical protein